MDGGGSVVGYGVCFGCGVARPAGSRLPVLCGCYVYCGKIRGLLWVGLDELEDGLCGFGACVVVLERLDDLLEGGELVVAVFDVFDELGEFCDDWAGVS